MLSCVLYRGWKTVFLFVRCTFCGSRDNSVCVSRLAMVCLVRKVILRSVLLKMFVLYVVSLPMYVKLAHFWMVWLVVGLSGLGVVDLCGFIVKDLLWRMLCIMISSCWYSLFGKL